MHAKQSLPWRAKGKSNGAVTAAKSNTNSKYEGNFIGLCRHDPTLVTSVQGVDLYGGSRYRVEDSIHVLARKKNLVLLDLCGMDFEDFTAPRAFASLKKHLCAPAHIIRLGWPDGGIPPVMPTFWTELHKHLVKGKHSLLASCMGGHGRTGTALASYLIANGGMNAAKATAIVHKNLCWQCIEQTCQYEYLYLLSKHFKRSEIPGDCATFVDSFFQSAKVFPKETKDIPIEDSADDNVGSVVDVCNIPVNQMTAAQWDEYSKGGW